MDAPPVDLAEEVELARGVGLAEEDRVGEMSIQEYTAENDVVKRKYVGR